MTLITDDVLDAAMIRALRKMPTLDPGPDNERVVVVPHALWLELIGMVESAMLLKKNVLELKEILKP